MAVLLRQNPLLGMPDLQTLAKYPIAELAQRLFNKLAGL
jgi:hypothetical protein